MNTKQRLRKLLSISDEFLSLADMAMILGVDVSEVEDVLGWHSIQEQVDRLDTIRGKVASHYDLANELESLGFQVRMDPENNERSEIVLMGCWNPDGSNIVVGEIKGDSEATIV